MTGTVETMGNDANAYAYWAVYPYVSICKPIFKS